MQVIIERRRQSLRRTAEISLLDAAIIKAYNCYSCDTFIYHKLDSFGKPVWKYTDINDYVKKVLEEKIPKY